MRSLPPYEYDLVRARVQQSFWSMKHLEKTMINHKARNAGHASYLSCGVSRWLVTHKPSKIAHATTKVNQAKNRHHTKSATQDPRCRHHHNSSQKIHSRISRKIHRLPHRLPPRHTRHQLPPHLRRNLRMRMHPRHIQQRILLVWRHIRCISLAEHEQALMPEHRQFFGSAGV